MQKEVIISSKAPLLAGAPVSPAMRIGQFVFTSGQIADDAKADIKMQTRQALEKIKALIEAARTSMDNVVKCTVYMTNLDEWPSMNEIYREFFKNNPPARSAVQVSRLVGGFKVEIEAIAYAP